jgi:hypothetical protein
MNPASSESMNWGVTPKAVAIMDRVTDL